MPDRRIGACARRISMLVLCILFCVILIITLAEPVWPEASGKKKAQETELTVDYSHAEDGYIMAKGKKTAKRLKLRIKTGANTMTYDLNSSAEWEVFPLQYGSGTYKISLYKNVSGNKYSETGVVTVKAKLKDENAPFLCPSQYVNYTSASPAVAKSNEICEGLTDPQEKFDAICSYIKADGFSYDYIKAVQMKSGTLPDIEGCFRKKLGVCQDLAAMTVCMLRVQGVPAKLMIGYADRNYHAWVVAIIDGREVFYDPTAELNAISRVKNYTVERFY